MKRKVVQHGPSTLTVSLPVDWVKDFGIKKGDEITIEHMRNGLFLTTGEGRQKGSKTLNVRGMPEIINKAISAIYKSGFDEIVVEYHGSDELQQLHNVLLTGYIGFEIVEETKDRVVIKKVSEPSEEEFKTLFRRIFHFLLSLAEDGVDAARSHDKNAYQKLILRDQNINKLADFCRRIVNKRGQTDYHGDTALYHIIEQLEKIGDVYKDINSYLLEQRSAPPEKAITLYRKANEMMREYNDLFFTFTLQKANALLKDYRKFVRDADALEDSSHPRFTYLVQSIAREIYNLLGVTMILHL